MIFAAGLPLEKKEIVAKIPELTTKELNRILAELSLKYPPESGIYLLTYGDKVELSSNPAFGDFLSEALQRIREKELSKALLEVLAIIAYKQPITRGELEEFRSRSADYAIGALLHVGLIKDVGKKDTIGHPTLFGTTDEFLRKFNLKKINDLPDYSDTLSRIRSLDRYNPQSDGLFSERSVHFDLNLPENESFAEIAADIDRQLQDMQELKFDLDLEKPDFISPDDDVDVIE
jgi:segregation and condensation protein B